MSNSTLRRVSVIDWLEVAPPPENRIPDGCDSISPSMLPLVDLESIHLEWISATVPDGAANIQDVYPLTSLQEGLLFHHLLQEQNDIYVVPTLLEFASRAHLESFVDALRQVIARHDALRTAVLWERLPRPVQVVYRHAPLPVDTFAVDRTRDTIEQLLERMHSQGRVMDLQRAPLLRLQITQDPCSQRWYGLLQIHHLICDGLSIEVTLTEAIACVRGHARQLGTPVQYRNHVARALALLSGRQAEDYFRGKLADIGEPTAPHGILEVRGGNGQFAKASQALDPMLVGRINEQARRCRVNVATLFHAAWALVVAHTSGRSDVVFGTVLFGRSGAGGEGQSKVGLYLNTLPLRLTLENLTARQLLELTQREILQLLRYEQFSLAAAQRCSGVSGSVPLFTSLLNYRHGMRNREAELTHPGFGVRVVARHGGTNYPITLEIENGGTEVTLKLQVDCRLDARRMLDHMSTAVRKLVEALEQAPDTGALSISVLPDEERRELLEEFNATQVAFPTGRLIHELFEEQAERTPDAQAVVFKGHSLTYEKLNAKANQLARHLRARGVGPDQLIGVCSERSLEMVLGILAILKAGGAYLPLDPTYPAERLTYMINDASPHLLLTQSSVTERLPVTGIPCIELDKHWNDISRHDNTNNHRIAGFGAENLAYVIYTSGSTGQPKGVMVEHRNVVNHWCSLEMMYRQPFDRRRIALNAPITFDASVQQWVQLLNGCTLFIVPQELRLDAQALTWFLNQNLIDGIDCTPSQLNSWIAADLLDDRQIACTVLVGGEAIDVALWQRLQRSREVRFYNVYGPTECTVDSTAADLREPAEIPHIGRPLANTQIYILDRSRQLVPVGVVGEIYIGGAGVARGYLNRAELTAERFLKNPFHEGGRMYRTGDLGRWRTDGTIEYVGRNDQQVKIRGFRIELGEIEVQLGRHPQVKEAVVIAREDVPGEKRLVGYVVLREGMSVGAEELRAHLKTILPEHMVPAAVVMLESLPQTLNGKLDRHALPPPELSVWASRQYEAPRGEIEQALATIWSEVLGVERVGRYDNFFELGGHSLLGIKLIARVADTLMARPPMTSIFKYATVQQMAQLVEKLLAGESNASRTGGMDLEGGVI